MRPRWILGVVLWVALLGESRAAWLQGKSASSQKARIFPGDGSHHGNCKVMEQTTCWCGDGTHRRQTIVDIKQCEYYTSWGPECEPCKTEEELCRSVEKCARCHRHNPNAICADCPSDLWGPRCEHERPCKTPNVTEHVTVHPYLTKRDVYKMEFRCTDGRVRVGPKTIRCLRSGKWNKEPPKCMLPVRCANLPTNPIPSTRVKANSYVWSEQVVYECDVGYIHSGRVLETAFQCHNGSWIQYGESVHCEPSPQCTTLLTFTGARLTLDSPVKSVYQAGEVVRYECEDNFSLLQNDDDNNNSSGGDGNSSSPLQNNNSSSGGNIFTLTCSGKQWIGLVPGCELIGCRKLSIEHGDVTYSGDSNSSQVDYPPLNSTAQITCHEGYTLDDPQQVTCVDKGRWEPSAPKCVPKVCEDLMRGKMCSVKPTAVNITAETNETEIYPGQIVKFRCKEHSYQKLNVGQTERICLHNGTLTGSEIQCKYFSTCKVVLPPGDQQIRYCRGSSSNCVQGGQDMLKDRTYHWPSDIVPPFATAHFFCSNSNYYCVNGSQNFHCMTHYPKLVQAPKCIPLCGRQRFPKRPLIMGGQSSGIAEWPWQSALMEVHFSQGRWGQADFMCGATLIDDSWAITAAHCVTTAENSTTMKDPANFRLTYGLSSSTQSKNHARDKRSKGKYKVAEFFIPNDYNPRTLHSDIALLRLETPVQIGEHVGVACLPTGEQQLEGGEVGVVTGWGQTESYGLSPDLQELSLTVVNASQCKEYFKDQGYKAVVVTEGMFCAMSNSHLSDARDGDSGSPFVVEDRDGHWVLEGIVSWGAPEQQQQDGVNRRAHVRISSGGPLQKACAGLACFGGYTRVAKYVQWIRETTNGQVGYGRCG